MKFDRRTVLLGGVGATGLAGLGAFGVYRMSDPIDYAQELLTELAGPFRIERADLIKMVEAAQPWLTSRKLRKLTLFSPAQGHLPEVWEDDLAGFQRRLLTQLVVYSDYLTQKDDPDGVVTYYGEQPCSNPFKRL